MLITGSERTYPYDNDLYLDKKMESYYKTSIMDNIEDNIEEQTKIKYIDYNSNKTIKELYNPFFELHHDPKF